MKKVFVVEPTDNVGTNVFQPIEAGDTVHTHGSLSDISVTASGAVPYGHKIAIRAIAKGETVYKYGLSIGSALVDIAPGDHVHVHNIESNRGRGDKVKKDDTVS